MKIVKAADLKTLDVIVDADVLRDAFGPNPPKRATVASGHGQSILTLALGSVDGRSVQYLIFPNTELEIES